MGDALSSPGWAPALACAPALAPWCAWLPLRILTVALRVPGRAADAACLLRPARLTQEWVDLQREKAALVDPGVPVYDSMIDNYEKVGWRWHTALHTAGGLCAAQPKVRCLQTGPAAAAHLATCHRPCATRA